MTDATFSPRQAGKAPVSFTAQSSSLAEFQSQQARLLVAVDFPRASCGSDLFRVYR